MEKDSKLSVDSNDNGSGNTGGPVKYTQDIKANQDKKTDKDGEIKIFKNKRNFPVMFNIKRQSFNVPPGGFLELTEEQSKSNHFKSIESDFSEVKPVKKK